MYMKAPTHELRTNIVLDADLVDEYRLMVFPIVLFILPVLFVVILGPAACSIADAFGSRGV